MGQRRAGHALGDERGFTILELIVAAAIVLVASFIVIDATHIAAKAAQNLTTANNDDSNVETQVQRWQTEAKSALAIAIEGDPNCSNGAQGGVGTPTVFAFYAKSSTDDTFTAPATPNGVWIRYTYDGAKTLTRDVVTLDANDTTKTVTLSSSSTPMASLSVQCIRPSSLTATAPELHGAAVHDYPVASPASLPGKAQAIGGNYLFEVTAKNASAARTIRLMAGTMTTGVTVEGPQWHTIIWREDHTRRFYIPPFFTGQHSWIRVHARVDVSWDNWQTPPKTWCDWEAWEVYDGPRTFDTSDIPFPREHDDLQSFPRVSDLLPDTLMTFCRDYPVAAGSTTGTNQPPGAGGMTGGTPTGGDDGDFNLPPYFVWQHCHSGTTWSTDPPTCTSASYNPNDVFSCDPQQPWNCTVTVPPVPSEGWDQWCSQYSAQTYGSTNPPLYNGPDHQCAAPPSPPPATPNPCDTSDPGNTPGTGPGHGGVNQPIALSSHRSPADCASALPTDPPATQSPVTPPPDVPTPPPAFTTPQVSLGSDTARCDSSECYSPGAETVDMGAITFTTRVPPALIPIKLDISIYNTSQWSCYNSGGCNGNDAQSYVPAFNVKAPDGAAVGICANYQNLCEVIGIPPTNWSASSVGGTFKFEIYKIWSGNTALFGSTVHSSALQNFAYRAKVWQ